MSTGAAAEVRPSLARASRWILLGAVASKPFQLATSICLARLLGPGGFGALSLANGAAATLTGVASLGLGDAANKLVAEHFRADRDTAAAIASLAVWLAVLSGLVACVAGFATRHLWAPGELGTDPAGTRLLLCLVLGFGNVVYSLALNLLSGTQRFRDFSLVGTLQAVAGFVLPVPLGFAFGVDGALLGAAIVSLSCVAVSLALVARVERRLLSFPRIAHVRHLARIANVGIPPWLAAATLNPLVLLAWTYLAAQSGGTQALGAFGTANGLKTLVAMLPGVVGAAIGPAIMQAAGRHGDAGEFEKLLRHAFHALAFLTLPVTVVAISMAELLFAALYGLAYAGAHALFVPLTVAVCILVVNSPLQMALVARERTWLLLAATAVKSFAFLGLAFLWIPDHRAAGLAWAWACSEVGFALGIAMLAAGLRIVPGFAVTWFGAFAMAALLALAAVLALPEAWRRWAGIPAAVAVGAALLRGHADIAVWISGSLPSAWRAPVRRILRWCAGERPE